MPKIYIGYAWNDLIWAAKLGIQFYFIHTYYLDISCLILFNIIR